MWLAKYSFIFKFEISHNFVFYGIMLCFMWRFVDLNFKLTRSE